MPSSLGCARPRMNRRRGRAEIECGELLAPRAEGLEVVGEGADRRLMIVYDSPHNHRTDADEGRLTGDLFTLD